MPDTEYVKLKDIKFKRHKRRHPTDSLYTNGKNYSVQNSGPGSKPQNDYTDATPYERLAGDKPGAQLAPEGTIWQIYVDEAKEYDSELVERENGNLDMMLLFAALFSAILTTFIIESKNLLQEDSSELTVTLLLAIAQSQQRMEQGSTKILPPIERPPFSSSMSARWINGLWFTALAFSLAAALVAMLAKEWLVTFKASRPRRPYDHAMVHQKRLDGLETWYASHLIDILPTMLHMSLLLFSLGLAIYLWTLDKGVAVAEVIITGATVTFYIGTALLGAIYPSCPFVTQISQRLVKPVLRRFKLRIPPTDNQVQGDDQCGSDEQLQALWWLAENARDPLAGDCVCQVLDAVSVEPFKPNENNRAAKESDPESAEPMPVTGHAEQSAPTAGHSAILDSSFSLSPTRHRAIKNLHSAILNRISEGRLRLLQEPDDYRGMNLAQYAHALPKLAYLLEGHARLSGDVESKATNAMERESKSTIASAFHALDSIWAGTYSELSCDSYAVFSSAELRLIEFAMSMQHINSVSKMPASFVKSQNGSGSRNGELSSTSFPSDNEVHIDIGSMDFTSAPTSVFELKARYSRVLSFIGYLLSYHNKYGMHITGRHLITLFESIEHVAQIPELNPADHMSTCLPQRRESDTLPNFTVVVTPRVAYEAHAVAPLAIGDEDSLLSGLVEAVSAADIQDTPTVELAAASALSTIAPMLLRQWTEMMNVRRIGRVEEDVSYAGCIETALQYWPSVQKDPMEGLIQSTLLQLLIIARISVELSSLDEMGSLPDIAIASLYRRANTVSGQAAWLELTKSSGFEYLISTLAEQVYKNSDRLAVQSRRLFPKLFLIENKREKIIHKSCTSREGLSYLLYAVARIPKTEPEAHLILDELLELLKSNSYYIFTFTHTAEGFDALDDVIYYHDLESSSHAINWVTGIIQHIAWRLRVWNLDLDFTIPAVSSMLMAVNRVLPAIIADKEEPNRLEELMNNVLMILRLFQKRDDSVLENCSSKLATLYDTVKPLTNWDDDFGEIVFEIGQLVDEDTMLYAGVERLFTEGNILVTQDN